MRNRQERVQLNFTLPTRTKQAFKDECDINKIVERFKQTQGPDFLDKLAGYVTGTYGDFSNIPDYREALDQVKKAQQMFDALPATVRKEFDNDPAYFLDFCQNPDNNNKLLEMGLLSKPPITNSPQNTPQNQAQKNDNLGV